MNMNKRVILFTISFLISFFVLNINVFAACSDVYKSFPYPSAEQCSSFSEDNFKCKEDGYSGGMVSKLKCKKSSECIDGFEYNNGYCVAKNSNNNSGNNNNNNNNNNNEVPCNTYTTEQQCGIIGKCKWNKVENTCDEVYVAEQPCSDDNIKVAIRFFGYLLLIAKVAIPLIIIVMGTIDLFKSVTDKDNKSFTKQLKILLMRIVAGVFVFFIPTIIYALFGISSNLNIVEEQKYKACIDCLLKPTKCDANGIMSETNGGNTNIHNAVGTNGTCSSGQTKGVDGICYNDGECGSYITKDTCPSVCHWSYRNGCTSR